jgi:hypothetical protein
VSLYLQSMLTRREDFIRHLEDLRTRTHEGAKSRAEKERVYLRGIGLLTPVALSLLEAANTTFLNGTGTIQVVGPQSDGADGIETFYDLSWPEQRSAWVRPDRGIHAPMPPVRIKAYFPRALNHPHIAAGSLGGNWPFQIVNADDAERQAGILAAIVELELHQRIYESTWQILPISQQLK